jgi:DNA polymerase alpha subunit A
MKDLAVDAGNSDAAPAVTVLSIGIKTLVNRSSLTSEIIAISGFVENMFNMENGTSSNNRIFSNHFCLVTKPSPAFQKIFPLDLIPSKIGQQYKQTKLEIANNERELLNLFMAKFFRIDPDVVVGHDVVDFDMEVLLQRLAHHKVGSWSKLGRLRRTGLVPVKKRDRMGLTCGRSVVDIKISARELIKAKSYDLTELAHQVLGEMRRDIDQDVLLSSYDRLPDFLKMVGWIMRDNQLTYRMLMELSVLPLALQITKIAGNSFSRTLLGGRSERNEFLLLHAFHDENYIVPDKFTFSKWTKDDHHNKQGNDGEEAGAGHQAAAGKKKAAYAGGLVLDPKIGYYTDYVLILDFNSLYPTIVREFNICFTTINLRAPLPQPADDSESEVLPPLPDADMDQGILPIQITRLVESRREVKKLLQNPDLTKDLQVQYDIKQKALKLTANSMYGCLGFGNSRFYAKPLAALITSKGREILMKTKNRVEELGYEVIYGDTDSIMINTHSSELPEAVKISNRVQSSVNGMHKYLEIECDGILKSMLLLKKKKYAALIVKRGQGDSVTYHKEMKGLDIVRRDWSVIAKTAGEHVVNEILSIDKPLEVVIDNIHQYLKQTAESLRSCTSKTKESIQQFVISKQLTKNPDEYPDKKNLSHVCVALAFNAKTDKKLRAGDVVPFIICTRISNTDNFNASPATHRAFHPTEVLSDDDLQVDVTYYLEQQIHPVVTRLIEPLDGTDAHTVAEFLGLDESFCPQKAVNAVDEIVAAGRHKFDICKSLILICPHSDCGREIEIRDPFVASSGDKKVWSLSRCPHCDVSFAGEKIGKKIEKIVRLRVRNLVDQFYAFSFTCEETMCGTKMSFSPAIQVKRSGVKCPECRALMVQDFPPPRFHLQLSFYENIFNFKEPATSDPTPPVKCYSLSDNLISLIRGVRQATSYNDVDLTAIFAHQTFDMIREKRREQNNSDPGTSATGVAA